jgi:hypothetical protein
MLYQIDYVRENLVALTIVVMLFRKHGLDSRVLQTRSGPIMMATLASGKTLKVFPPIPNWPF